MTPLRTPNDIVTKRTLGELVQFLDHLRKPVTESDRKPGPYPYYGANGQQGTIDGYLFDEPLILLAEDGGHFDDPSRGVAYRICGKSWVNNHAHVLRPTPEIDLNYLYRVLENYNLRPYVTGTTRGKLTKAGAASIPIPVPSYRRQKIIAAVLDKADNLRAKRRAALAQLDTLTESIFLDMFGDPLENASRFPVFQLYELIDPGRPITYGILKPGPLQSDGVSYVRVVDLRDGGIDTSGVRKTTAEISSAYRRSLLNPGDLLMSIRGHVGRLAIVPCELNGANITQDTARLAVVGSEPVYVRECLRNRSFQQWMEKHTKGVAVRGINLGDVKVMPIPVPPLSMQQDFVCRIRAIERLRAVQRASLAELNTLFMSLQHRAFRGEL